MKVNLLTIPIPNDSEESWWGKIYIQSKQKMQERNCLPHENVTILAHTPKQHTISLQSFFIIKQKYQWHNPITIARPLYSNPN